MITKNVSGLCRISPQGKISLLVSSQLSHWNKPGGLSRNCHPDCPHPSIKHPRRLVSNHSTTHGGGAGSNFIIFILRQFNFIQDELIFTRICCMVEYIYAFKQIQRMRACLILFTERDEKSQRFRDTPHPPLYGPQVPVRDLFFVGPQGEPSAVLQCQRPFFSLSISFSIS